MSAQLAQALQKLATAIDNLDAPGGIAGLAYLQQVHAELEALADHEAAPQQEPDKLDAEKIEELAAERRLCFGHGAADFNAGIDAMADEIKRYLARKAQP